MFSLYMPYYHELYTLLQLSNKNSCVINILAVLGASQCVRKKKEIKQARAALIHHLQEQHCLETLCDFVSPLNPSFVCKRIK